MTNEDSILYKLESILDTYADSWNAGNVARQIAEAIIAEVLRIEKDEHRTDGDCGFELITRLEG